MAYTELKNFPLTALWTCFKVWGDFFVLNKHNRIYSDSLDNSHGRLERRECCFCNDIGWLHNREKWTDLYGIGMTIARVEENGCSSEQRHYFIYSCKGLNASELMRAKRSHWSMRNSLHWVLDMSFREDESRAGKGFSAEKFNALRHFAYNILKSDSSFKGSFPDKRFKCMLDSAFLDNISCPRLFVHNLLMR